MTLTSTTTRPSERSLSGFERGDVVGLALLAAAVIWTFVAATSAGDPWPIAGMFLLVGVAFVGGRVASRRTPFFVPAVVVAVALLLSLLWLAGALPEGADAAPLGYANARSAFFVEAAAAAVMLALFFRGKRMRSLVLIVPVAFAIVPVANESLAASVVVAVMLPAAAAFAFTGWRPRVAVGTFAALMGLSLASTLAVAGLGSNLPGTQLAADILGARRIQLWGDALEMMTQQPITGVGPGRFAAESETAMMDRDARWAHHGFLHQGAETGMIGLVVLALLFGWGFWRLMSGSNSSMTVMGAFVLGTVGILACSDYLLHFPSVTGVAAFLVGSASQRYLHGKEGALRSRRFAVLPSDSWWGQER